MKIVLVDGEDVSSSRRRFAQIINSSKKKRWDIVRVDPKNKHFKNYMVTSSLFPKKTLYVVDNIQKLIDADLDFLNKNQKLKDTNILLFNSKDTAATVIKKLPKYTKRENFKLPKVIFQYLDSLYPGNSDQALKLLTELRKTNPAEAILALMGRHLRDLHWSTLPNTNLSYPDWRTSKLKSQASKFTQKSLKNLINDLALIDHQSKTSKPNLDTLLDLTLAKHLK